MDNKMNILVLGLGISGKAAVELAHSRGYSVIGIDENSSPDLNHFKENFKTADKVKISTGFKEKTLPPADLTVISPGIADNSFLGKLAAESNSNLISELNFASRFISVPLLSITGTNGKTTVTEMTTEILSNAGVNALSAGNIGLPLSKTALMNKKPDAVAVEVSSFQLDNSPDFTPAAAALLNIASDHIDRYAHFTAYSDAKFHIFDNISDTSCMILNHNLLSDWKKHFSDKFPDKRPITFSATEKDADITFSNGEIHFNSLGIKLRVPGKSPIGTLHNIENLMAAGILASKLVKPDILTDALEKIICEFRTSPHRQEIILEENGILFVNDSKATNPSAVIAALDRFGNRSNICLVAGGLDKKMDFSIIKSRKNKIKSVFLAGEAKKSLATLWNCDIRCVVCDSFEESVTKAVDSAASGDVVLLSPGCASMDMFKNYKKRGDKFRTIIYNRRSLR